MNKYDGFRSTSIGLGGEVAGWLGYLAQNRPNEFGPLALADSSTVALSFAESVLPNYAQRYHIDLMQLKMSEQWNVAFLLDVIEHLPDDLQAMKQAQEALRHGCYLFVTAPAFRQFWSYNDDIAHHLRRYRRSVFRGLQSSRGSHCAMPATSCFTSVLSIC